MTPVWAVVRREYLQRVRSKWFLLTTFGAPVLFLAIALAPIYFGERDARSERRIAVLDETGVLFERVEATLAAAGLEVERIEPGDGVEGSLSERVRDDELAGYLLLDEGTLSRGSVRYVGGSRPSPVRELTLRQGAVQAALQARLDGTAEDVGALVAGGSLEVEILGPERRGADGPDFFMVYIGTFLLYMTVLLYAVAVMRSVLEEKTSRIVEVVISSMRPWHLMLGKILGVGAVGLTQLGVWVGLVAIALLAGLPAMLVAAAGLQVPVELGDLLPDAGFLGLFLTFFLFGYFIFAGLYAAVGAMCSTDQEAQQAQTPLIFLLVVPIVILPRIMETPESGLATGLSLVPFFSPILMFARAGMDAAPAWQVALSVVLMAATVVAVAWVAGRIYRTGILMTGKRPTLPELVRWIRES